MDCQEEEEGEEDEQAEARGSFTSDWASHEHEIPTGLVHPAKGGATVTARSGQGGYR